MLSPADILGMPDDCAACRVGQPASFLALLEKSAPKLAGFVRESVKNLVRSKPEFYPMPGWTHLSQLHGPKVYTAVTDMYSTYANSPQRSTQPLV